MLKAFVAVLVSRNNDPNCFIVSIETLKYNLLLPSFYSSFVVYKNRN